MTNSIFKKIFLVVSFASIANPTLVSAGWFDALTNAASSAATLLKDHKFAATAALAAAVVGFCGVQYARGGHKAKPVEAEPIIGAQPVVAVEVINDKIAKSMNEKKVGARGWGDYCCTFDVRKNGVAPKPVVAVQDDGGGVVPPAIEDVEPIQAEVPQAQPAPQPMSPAQSAKQDPREEKDEERDVARVQNGNGVANGHNGHSNGNGHHQALPAERQLMFSNVVRKDRNGRFMNQVFIPSKAQQSMKIECGNFACRNNALSGHYHNERAYIDNNVDMPVDICNDESNRIAEEFYCFQYFKVDLAQCKSRKTLLYIGEPGSENIFLEDNNETAYSLKNFACIMGQAFECGVDLLYIVYNDNIRYADIGDSIGNFFEKMHKKDIQFDDIWVIAHGKGGSVAESFNWYLQNKSDPNFKISTAIYLDYIPNDGDNTVSVNKVYACRWGDHNLLMPSQQGGQRVYNINVSYSFGELLNIPTFIDHLPRLIHGIDDKFSDGNYLLDAQFLNGAYPTIKLNRKR